MEFGLILIGSELLTGKRQDKHLPAVIKLLAKRGLELSWVQIVDDDEQRLVSTIKTAVHSQAVVFCCGGIGATPDDRTRQAVAAATGHELSYHPEGKALLENIYGERLYPHRIRMIEFPTGATLIPNPVNQVPGFSLGKLHCVPGFPDMAWPMLDWVLDEHYAELAQEGQTIESLLRVVNVPESDLIPQMELIEAAFPSIRLSCLPHAESGKIINEYGFRGQPDLVVAAMSKFKTLVIEAGFADHLANKA